MRRTRTAVLLTLAAGAAILATRETPAAAADHARAPTRVVPSTARRTAVSVTRVAMRDVDFHVDPKVVLRIRRLDGTMRSRDGGPVVFDDKRGFVLHLDAAEVGITGADLGALLNTYVFNYKGCPITHLTIATSGSEVVERGRMRKGVELPFEIHARLDVMPDGRIRMRPTRTTILGVNGKALLGALHLSLAKLLDLRGARGVTVQGNDLFLQLDSILPPPAIEGRVTAVRVDGDQVVQQFGPPVSSGALTPPDGATHGFMYYRGGELRFGKLLMLDAEMEIVGLDREHPFAFDLDRYSAQLVAGYSRTLSDQGLEVFMRGADRLTSASSATRGCPGGDACPARTHGE